MELKIICFNDLVLELVFVFICIILFVNWLINLVKVEEIVIFLMLEKIDEN